MRDDKAISLINTKDRSITHIMYCPSDFWAPLTMEIGQITDSAGAPTQ